MARVAAGAENGAGGQAAGRTVADGDPAGD